MGIAKLKKVAKSPQVDFVADLSAYAETEGEEIQIRFRRPGVADYFQPAKLRQTLLIAFPELSQADGTLASYLLIMGACYIPDPGEALTEPWRVLAQMGRDNEAALLDLINQFQSAFPAAMAQAKADAKNDLTQ